jgi:transposase
VKLGDFRTVWDVIAWVEARWGICYSYEGMRSVMKRNQCVLKVPRPQSEKANEQQQEDWQKKGFGMH